jgi:hypothetical protein
MKNTRLMRKLALVVSCPTCGVAAGKRCVLVSGDLRTEPHASRKVAASEAVVTQENRSGRSDLSSSPSTF